MNPRRFRVGLGQTEDASTVVDEQQIRQSFFDPNMPPPDPAMYPYDGSPLQTVTVMGHQSKPLWPLLIVLAIVGYVVLWGEQQKA